MGIKSYQLIKNTLDFHPERSLFKLIYSPCGYFRGRPHINFHLTSLMMIAGFAITGLTLWSLFWLIFFAFCWGEIHLYLPFLPKGKYKDCGCPKRGVVFEGDGSKIYFNSVWIWKGCNSKLINMPWKHWGK